jgi:hypothetical protein
MSGGGGNGPSMGTNTAAARKAGQIQPVPTADLSLGQYPGMGYTPVESPFTAQGKPPWMQGWFDMPTWGMSASNPSRALTQQDLMAQNQLPTMGAKAPVQQQAPEPEPEKQEDPVREAKRYMSWRNANSLNSLGNKGGIPYGNDNDVSYENYLRQLSYWNR